MNNGFIVELLSKFEELVLLTVLKLKENAYGRAIYDEILKATGKKMSVGNIYFPLERLTEKGYLFAFKGEPIRKKNKSMNLKSYVPIPNS
ncbi:MAG: helix-turn-helix transcriptional regulator [Thermoplasmatales archaeon]|nr:MAG: helix-turn-helix transcriptional regulator [Thermoplasmatales archaeon]